MYGTTRYVLAFIFVLEKEQLQCVNKPPQVQPCRLLKLRDLDHSVNTWRLRKSHDFQKTVARLARKAIGQDFSRALRWANERGYTVMGSIA